MKKYFWFVVISIILLVSITLSYAVNSGEDVNNKINNNDFLQLVLRIDGEKIQGEVKSIIIQTKLAIFFFGDNGKCVKKLNLNNPWPIFKISPNHQYIAIVEKGNKDSNHSLNLYNYNGKLLWSKNDFTLPVSILGVANDGTRVLIRIPLDDETNYPNIISYLNEKGISIASLHGLEIEQNESEFIISPNCRYWICRDKPFSSDPDKKWLFFNSDGKKIRESKAQGTITTLGDNGNYVIQINSDCVLSTFNGQVIKKFVDNYIDLAKSGSTVFYVDDSNYVFEEGQNIRYIAKKEIDNVSSGLQRVLDDMSSNFSYKGDYIVVRLKHSSIYHLAFIYKTGNIVLTKIDTNQLGNFDGIHHEIVNFTDLFGIWGSNFTRLNLYKVK